MHTLISTFVVHCPESVKVIYMVNKSIFSSFYICTSGVDDMFSCEMAQFSSHAG